MVGLQAYGTILMSNENTPGVGTVLPGDFNTASVTQDVNNINAGLVRINFTTPFKVPPVVCVQGVRVCIEWMSPGANPFHEDGFDVHREVFPLPPSKAINGEVDEILDVTVGRVEETSVGQPASSRIEIENKLLNNRLLRVERTFIEVQFSAFIGKAIRVRPFTLEGVDSVFDVQEGTVTQVLFGYMAAGDLDAF